MRCVYRDSTQRFGQCFWLISSLVNQVTVIAREIAIRRIHSQPPLSELKNAPSGGVGEVYS